MNAKNVFSDHHVGRAIDNAFQGLCFDETGPSNAVECDWISVREAWGSNPGSAKCFCSFSFCFLTSFGTDMMSKAGLERSADPSVGLEDRCIRLVEVIVNFVLTSVIKTLCSINSAAYFTFFASMLVVRGPRLASYNKSDVPIRRPTYT